MAIYAVASILIILALSTVLPTTSHYLHCSDQFYIFTTKNNIPHCQKLTTLEAEFGWRIDENNQSRIRMVFGTRKHNNMAWLAFGVNPLKSPQMVGTRAIIGIRQPNGTLIINTYNITSDTKLGCKLVPSRVEVEFHNLTFGYENVNDLLLLQATIGLNSGYDISKLNIVWQVGYEAEGNQPKMHSRTLQNFDSVETINLMTGYTHHVGLERHYSRVMHGVFNIVGWGIFLPTGVVVARYYKYPLEWMKDSWLKVHISCQVTGYIFGSIGWAIGLWLGHASKSYTFHTHRLFAIFIFSFATLQLLALHFKPAIDGVLRGYWNMYHHLSGHVLLVVIGINIFKGIAIFKPQDASFKWTYVGILCVFAVVFISLEIYSWTKFKGQKKEAKIPSVSPEQTQKDNGSQPSSSSQLSSLPLHKRPV